MIVPGAILFPFISVKVLSEPIPLKLIVEEPLAPFESVIFCPSEICGKSASNSSTATTPLLAISPASTATTPLTLDKLGSESLVPVITTSSTSSSADES